MNDREPWWRVVVETWMAARPGLCPRASEYGRTLTVWIEDDVARPVASAQTELCEGEHPSDVYAGALVAVSVAEGFAMLAKEKSE